MLENEMEVNADNLRGIVEQGHQMAKAGHFDSASILKTVQDFDKRCAADLTTRLQFLLLCETSGQINNVP